MGTIIICLILAVICIFAVRSYVKKLRSGCCGAGEDPVKSVRPSDRDLSHYPYSCKIMIEGMSCKNCAKRVENEFNERDGYYASVDLKGNCAVVHMKQKQPADTRKKMVEHAGYSAVSVEPA